MAKLHEREQKRLLCQIGALGHEERAQGKGEDAPHALPRVRNFKPVDQYKEKVQSKAFPE